MQATLAQTASTPWMVWAGRIASTLVVLFLLFDGAISVDSVY